MYISHDRSQNTFVFELEAISFVSINIHNLIILFKECVFPSPSSPPPPPPSRSWYPPDNTEVSAALCMFDLYVWMSILRVFLHNWQRCHIPTATICNWMCALKHPLQAQAKALR